MTIAASQSPDVSFGQDLIRRQLVGRQHDSVRSTLGIMRVSANDGTPELIVPSGQGEQIWRPQLLPGGDGVLFTVVMPGTGAVNDGDVVVQSLSSGKRRISSGRKCTQYVPTGTWYTAYAKS